MHGRIRSTPTGYALVFVRDLAASTGEVWTMLTDRSSRAEWLFDGEIEPRLGGRVDLRDDQHHVTGQVTAWRPNEVMALTWSSPDAPEGEVRFELTALDDDRCRLQVVHATTRTARPRSLAAGWHAMLDRLVPALGLAQGGHGPGFQRLVHDYATAPIEQPAPPR